MHYRHRPTGASLRTGVGAVWTDGQSRRTAHAINATNATPTTSATMAISASSMLYAFRSRALPRCAGDTTQAQRSRMDEEAPLIQIIAAARDQVAKDH